VIPSDSIQGRFSTYSRPAVPEKPKNSSTPMRRITSETINPAILDVPLLIGKRNITNPVRMGKKIMTERAYSNILTPYLVDRLREEEAH
jgi:hypothetical protein